MNILRFFILSVLVCFAGGSFLAGNEINFADSRLEYAVRNELNIPEGPIYISDVEHITELLVQEYDIEYLGGIEYFSSLEHLNLRANNIQDVTPLQVLSNLYRINLRDNAILELADINIKALQDLPNLRELSLRHNRGRDEDDDLRLSDLSLLEGFEQLEWISLRDNHISDISVFADLPNLRDLNLRENFISDLSPLSDHNKLQGPGSRLYLEDNPLFDYSPIYHYAHLIETVDFDDLLQVNIPDPDLEQAIYDKLTALYGEVFLGPVFWSDLKKIQELDVRDLAVRNLEGLQFARYLEELNIRDNGLTDELFDSLNLELLADLEHLWYLNIRGNELTYLGETSPIRHMTQLEFLSMRDNDIEDISALAYLVDLKNLNARNNRITDLTPLGGLENLLERLYLSGNDELSDFSPIAHYYDLIETKDFIIPPDDPSGPVYINEVMASNGSTISDEDGDFEDWIELYNAGDSPYDLGGYYISDDETNITRWQFPQGVTIPANGFLLVWASGKNRANWPGELHTNFRISSDGEPIILTAPDGTTIIDYMPSVPMERDQSYGRYPDGTGDWYYYEDPTPEESNPPPPDQPLDPPAYSLPGGWYEEPFSLELHTEEGTIRYTLDGSEPDENSPVYSGPILIQNRTSEPNTLSNIRTNDVYDGDEKWNNPIGNVYKGTVVRARVFQTGKLPSETVTHSYFVDEQKASRYSFPTISITTHRDNFFDNNIGIYVPGYHDNYFQRGEEWERPGHMEFFEKDGTTAFSQGVGLRIHGGTSRNRPLKTLRIYSRADYGQPWFEYQLFPDKPVDEYKRFLLRNSGNDWNQSFFRDAFMQSLLQGLNLDKQSYRPVIVFINGEYWGIHNTRDRIDQYYLETHYGIQDDKFVMMEMLQQHGAVFDRGNPDGAQHYHDMIDYIDNNGVSCSSHYEHVSQMMDMDNFIDYNIAQIFFMNTDWPGNNNDFWRYITDEYDPTAPYGKDGRWRWIVFDLDFGFGLDFHYVPGRNDFAAHNTLAFATDPSGPDWPNPPVSTFLLRNLLENEDFRRAFINRFADLMNTRFAPSHVESVINEFRQNLEPEMLEHHRRWYGTDNLSAWFNDIDRMKSFADQRPGHQRNHIINHFDLSGITNINIEVSDPSMGTVHLNSLDLADKLDANGWWSGTYFQDIPLPVRAVAFPGYVFTGWDEHEEAGKEMEITPTGAELTLRANFEPDVHSLAEGPYLLNYWSPEEPAGSYPPAMVFEQSSQVDPDLDAPLTHYYELPYNNESRTRMVGLHSDGFAFINTGGTDHWHEGTQGRDLGAATLSLNTQGAEEIHVGFRAGTVIPNSRVYGLQLQYRIGNEGPFTNLQDGGIPVNYIRNEKAGHNNYFGPFSLPQELADQELVQLRWRYHHISGTDGPRAMLRLNDIMVTGEAPHYPEDLLINEILWENESLEHPVYLDEDGSGQPFVELYNRGEEDLFLGGYYLTDSLENPTKWSFPEITLEGKEYLRIWLSGKNRTYDGNHLHTNFMVSPQAHSLYIVHFDGSTVLDQAPEDVVAADHSLGRMPDGEADWTICDVPTPGYPNNYEILKSPSFSPEPAFYSDPLTVTINNPEPGAVILYTLDGSDPWHSSPVQQGQPGENVDIHLEKGSIVTVYAMVTHPSGIPSLSVQGYYEVEGTIEPPQFSHPDGEYFFQPADVTISCPTPNAHIRYTSDGSNPADSATAVTTEAGEDVTIHLPVSSHTRIRAYSFLPGWDKSPEVSAEYFVSRNIDGIFDDWTEDELREESADHNPWTEPHNLSGLWVAWDQAFLYIGMTGRVQNQNRLSTYLCLDESRGITNLSNSRYSHQGNAFNITASGFGVDFAFETDSSSHGIWQYNAADDLFDNITSTGKAAWHQNGLMNSGYEAAIPWKELFTDIPEGQIVPENLSIRLISILQNNCDSGYYSSDDIIPASNRDNGNYSPGIWHAVPDYLEIDVDSSGDGMPDTPPVIRFILDMEDFDTGQVQVRGNAPFLAWEENAPVMEQITDNIYQWSHSLSGLDNQTFEYKFTNTLGDTTYWSPTGDNLQHQIVPGEDNIIEWSWDNYQVPRQAGAPQFSLPGGAYEEPQDIYLFTPTDGAIIYYTTDGSDPRTSTTVISSMPGETVHIHLPAGSDTMIRAYAAGEGLEDSAVVSAHYIIQGQEVFFPDPGLEAAVRDAISLAYGPIYTQDILPLTELDAEERGIEYLTGIEELINLENLVLRNNIIGDLSLLESMENLTVLDLRGNQITDITPLSSLTNLINLNLRDNQISCIEPLEPLVNMVTLRLHTNMISDISILQHLTKIEYLSMRNNQINDISVLAYLTELKDLNLRDNLINDISSLEDLPNLRDRLYLSGNPDLIDFSPVAHYYNEIAEVDFEIKTGVSDWHLFR